MPSTPEYTFAAADALWRAGECVKSRERIPVPRTALVIYAGLRVFYPEVLEDSRGLIAFRKINDLAPLLIGLNEFTDIGISLNMGKNPRPEAGEIEKKLCVYVANWRRDYLGKHPEDKPIISRFINNFCILSLWRSHVLQSSHPEFLELDSLIFEDACLSVAGCCKRDPLSLQDQTYNDLVRQYRGLFVFTDLQPGNVVDQRWKTLHALEMLMKIHDDKRGVRIDSLLNLPNLQAFDCDKLISQCRRQLSTGGVSWSIAQLMLRLLDVTSTIKSSIARSLTDSSRPLVDLIPEGNEVTTSLRHRLFNKR